MDDEPEAKPEVDKMNVGHTPIEPREQDKQSDLDVPGGKGLVTEEPSPEGSDAAQ